MKYDLIIVGRGPAGSTAAIYAARYKLNTLLITKEFGGMATKAYEIKNFPSYKSISGIELMKRIEEQVKSLGVKVVEGEVTEIIGSDGEFEVKTENDKVETKKIIIATGTKKRKLNIENEEKFLGRGISYCAVCDAPLFNNKIVCVVGGGSSALTAALLLSKYANKVYIIHRGPKFDTAEPALIEEAEKDEKIELIFDANVISAEGSEFLERIKLDNGNEIETNGLFIEIGSIPNSELAKKIGIETDEKGYIITDELKRTNVKGIYAAGDVTNNKLKQIITACAEGAIAATTAYNEL